MLIVNSSTPLKLALGCDRVIYIAAPQTVRFPRSVTSLVDIQLQVGNPMHINCQCIDLTPFVLGSIPDFKVDILDILPDGTIGSNSYYGVDFSVQSIVSNLYRHTFVLQPSLGELDISNFVGDEVAIQLREPVALTTAISCISSAWQCEKIHGDVSITGNVAVNNSIDVVKRVLSITGSEVTYGFTVENTGEGPLTGITITDPLGPILGGPITLLPGETDTSTFSLVYTITAADVNAGFVQNTATAQAVTINGLPVFSDPSSVTVSVLAPSISIAKSVSSISGSGTAIGDMVTYGFTVQNTGAVRLDGVTINDPLGPILGGPITLLPGETDTSTFSLVYTITAADVNAGFVQNTATAQAVTINGLPVFSDPSSVTVSVLAPSISIAKSVSSISGSGTAIGDMVTYGFTVQNTGAVRLDGVTINDPLGPILGGPITLLPGETDTSTFSLVYTITAADVNAGVVTNTATAVGIPSNGQPFVTDTDTAIFATQIANPPLSLPEHFDIASYNDLFNGDVNVDNKDNRLHEGETLTIPFTTTWPIGTTVEVYWGNTEEKKVSIIFQVELIQAVTGNFIDQFITGNTPGPGTTDLPITNGKLVQVTATSAIQGLRIVNMTNSPKDPHISEITINGISNI